MCGIVGQLCLPGAVSTVDADLLARMRDSMEHRGPDGAGQWVADDGRIGLGHRRLAIVDLDDSAAQPMASPCGRYQLSFNGEIYNHAEIRAELTAAGVSDWRTDHSDTEVLLFALRHWGIEALERLRGMFAFALWDARERQLWLVRDRIGVKPLYYVRHGDRFSFASEIKALLMDPDVPRRMDEESLFHFLSFLFVPAPRTLFEGIDKLEPGHWLRIDADGGMRMQRYWDVWDGAAPAEGADDDALAAGILEDLRASVDLRAVSDVPVGVFLSGGVDSSANTALFAQRSAEAVRTFSIGYEGELQSYQNELEHARFMAETVGAVHRERLLSLDDLLEVMPRIVWHQDEPIADPVCIPVYYVAELARRSGVTVCQVGEGADELFMGYTAWRTMRRLQEWGNLPLPDVLRGAGLGLARALGRQKGRPYEWLSRNYRGQPVFWSGAERFTGAAKQDLLSTRLRADLRGRSSWETIEPIWNDFRDKAWEPSTLHWMSYADLRMRLPELLLMRVDKMTMATSLEARVPFLDHRFVERALSIPERRKVHGGESKYLLKKAVRGLVPDRIIDRPKQGFGVPVQDYLFDRLGPVMETTLRNFVAHTDVLDQTGVDALFARRDGGGLWTLYNLALWWERFIDTPEPVRP
ncbi:MAG: asparagine synthase (glutamine-hydrolyzing) [Gammaproteobacteria bacterium]